MTMLYRVDAGIGEVHGAVMGEQFWHVLAVPHAQWAREEQPSRPPPLVLSWSWCLAPTQRLGGRTSVWAIAMIGLVAAIVTAGRSFWLHTVSGRHWRK